MIKKDNINRTFPLWIIVFLLITIPINLSYKNITNISLGVINHAGAISEGYLFTLPLSYLFAIPFILLGVLNFNKDRSIFLFLCFILFSLFSFLFNHDLSYFLLVVKIITPILALLGFEVYFTKQFLLSKKKNILQIIKNSNHKIGLIFLTVFLISIISPLYLNDNFYWLTGSIAVYDYYQYYPLIFILLLGILEANKLRFLLILTYILSFYLSKLSSNFTYLSLLIIYGIYYIFCLSVGFKKNSLVYLSKIFISIIFLVTILYPLIVITLYAGIVDLDFLNDYGKFTDRMIVVFKFYNRVNFFDFLTPIRTNTEVVSRFYHNEFSVIISALGVFGALFFYFVFLKRIWYISKYYPQISVAIALASILSGVFVTTNLHPYTLIILSFIISYYYVLSKFHSQKPL